MQAVILAAGRGTRMKELTASVPKPMLLVQGKSLIAHKLDALPDTVTEVILVIGYQGDAIKSAFGDAYQGKAIRYVVQEELNGTAGALWQAKDLLTDRFVVMMGDDLYAKEDVDACFASPDWSVLAEELPSMRSGGKIALDGNGSITAIEEGNHEGLPGLMNTNMLVLDPRVFEYPLVPKAPGSDEYGLPQTVLNASRESGIPLRPVTATFWIQITAPEDLDAAARTLAGR